MALVKVDRIEYLDAVTIVFEQLSTFNKSRPFGSSTFTLFFFGNFEKFLYDVGSQREFERISFRTLSFMVALPFSAKRKMTL